MLTFQPASNDNKRPQQNSHDSRHFN